MTTRYFRHQSCEPDDEISAEDAAALANHVRRRDVAGGAIIERVRDGALIEVVYQGIEPAGHAARHGAVPYVTLRDLDGPSARVRERVEHEADGVVKARSRTTLDEAGRPSVEEWFDGLGTPTSRDVYTWRGDDLIRVVTHRADGTSFVAYEDDDG